MTEVINLQYPFEFAEQQPAVIAMGLFDGVHLGHAAVIQRAKAIAEEKQTTLTVLTYDRHASELFGNHNEPFKYLTTLDRRIQLISQMGADRVIVMTLDHLLTALAPQEFVDNVLMKLNPVAVVAGSDHHYGPPNSITDMQHLPIYAAGRFDVSVVPLLADQEANKIGSTAIRQAMQQGEIERANQLLGREFLTSGEVVHGFARGRTLGYPTANIETPNEQMLPAEGVYITSISLDGRRWLPTMTSIGTNATFKDDDVQTVESYILDFDQDIYGQTVQLRWLAFLRHQKKFNSVGALVEALQQDELATRQFFTNASRKD